MGMIRDDGSVNFSSVELCFFLSSELWDPFCFAARRVVRNANNEKRELQVGLHRVERHDLPK